MLCPFELDCAKSSSFLTSAVTWQPVAPSQNRAMVSYTAV